MNMNKKLVGLTLLVTGLGGSSWIVSKFSQTTNDNRELRAQLQAFQSRLGTVESQLIQRRSENQSILISKIRKAQEADLKAQVQRNANESFEREADLDSGEMPAHPSSLHERIEQEKKAVEGLLENQRQIRGQISQLKKQRNQNQLNLQNEQKSVNDQYTNQITQVSQSIEQIQTQLDVAKKAYGTNQFDLVAAQSINELNAQMSVKNSTLQSLKEQRANENIQRSAQRTTTISQFQAELDELETNEQAISDQLAHERETLLLLKSQENSELSK